MINDDLQEVASLYVMDELTAEQSARFEAEMSTDLELRALVLELAESYAALSLAAPLHPPPPALKEKILNQFREENRRNKVLRPSFVPWALAAALAVATTYFFFQQERLRQEVASLRNRDALSEMRVANLQAQVEAFSNGAAVVIWDQTEQKGRVRFEKLPVQKDKDYQLWVLDPQQAQPISAGVVRVAHAAPESQEFRPDVPIGNGSKFAISIEQKGGAKQPAGEIVFIGE